MGYSKQISLTLCGLVVFVLALAASPAANVGAIKSPAAVAEDLSDELSAVDAAARLSAIAENCSDIQYALTQLQHSDSRTRTYLGTSYETIVSRFITPLNLRLEHNNQPSEQLLGIQSEFATTQADFRLAYTEYMRNLESLIAVDCSNRPEEFYDQLEITRAKRSALQGLVQKLNALVGEQYQAVSELEESL